MFSGFSPAAGPWVRPAPGPPGAPPGKTAHPGTPDTGCIYRGSSRSPDIPGRTPICSPPAGIPSAPPRTAPGSVPPGGVPPVTVLQRPWPRPSVSHWPHPTGNGPVCLPTSVCTRGKPGNFCATSGCHGFSILYFRLPRHNILKNPPGFYPADKSA